MSAIGKNPQWQLLADSTLSASLPVAARRYEFKNQAPINSKEPITETREHPHREAWNKGKLVGQKAPLKPKDIWAIRIHLQNAHAVRDLAMFNLAIDSKLRGCDLVGLRVRDVTHGRSSLRPHGRLPCGRFLASCRMRTVGQKLPVDSRSR